MLVRKSIFVFLFFFSSSSISTLSSKDQETVSRWLRSLIDPPAHQLRKKLHRHIQLFFFSPGFLAGTDSLLFLIRALCVVVHAQSPRARAFSCSAMMRRRMLSVVFALLALLFVTATFHFGSDRLTPLTDDSYSRSPSGPGAQGDTRHYREKDYIAKGQSRNVPCTAPQFWRSHTLGSSMLIISLYYRQDFITSQHYHLPQCDIRSQAHETRNFLSSHKPQTIQGAQELAA